MIDYIRIYGLHNEMDISLEFNSPVKIIIGDNGSGKTTVLNALYYILTKNFVKLYDLDFERICFKFTKSEEFTITKKDISFKFSPKILKHPAIRIFNKFLSETDLLDLLSIVYIHSDDQALFELSSKSSFKTLLDNTRYSAKAIFHRLDHVVETELDINSESTMNKDLFSNDLVAENFQNILKVIDDNVQSEVLYLPTYRRVEEAIRNFSDLNEDVLNNNPLINFGMKDVEQRFKRIQRELKDSAVKLYSNLNGRMLTQLASQYKAAENEFTKIQNTDALKIVFARVGDSITNETEQNILSLIDSGSIKEDRYHPLVFILSNLIDVYDQQKETDESIKEFIEVANKYLVKKQFVYDENNVEISVINKKSRHVVELENLSSGEKQLLALFSLLYLEKKNDYIVIFDEPELSLSIEWQEMLLPDMWNSGKCKFLVSATHSPFIFDNEFDKNAGIIEIIKEYSE